MAEPDTPPDVYTELAVNEPDEPLPPTPADVYTELAVNEPDEPLPPTPSQEGLRPVTLDDFAGQPTVSRELGIILGAAKKRGDLGDHLLLSGPPGLGKTTISGIVAHELGVPMVTVSGPAVEKPGDIVGIVARIAEPTVLFIDEIHRLPASAEEHLYSAMEDGRVDVIIGEGARARSIPLPLAPFILVGATTQAGLLSAPLRDRFGHICKLRLYSTEALTGIVERSARILGIELGPGAAETIAARAQGTPRVANMWLRRTRDWSQTEGQNQQELDAAGAKHALAAFGVDNIGLTQTGRDLLDALCTQFGGGPVGVNSLASAVGETTATVEDMYEPYLARAGLLKRTPRGRVATEAAYLHLNLPVPSPAAVPGRAFAATRAAHSKHPQPKLVEDV